MISDELKTALVSGARDVVFCGFCGKTWLASEKAELEPNKKVTINIDPANVAIYQGDSVPFGDIVIIKDNLPIHCDVPVICDCKILENFEANVMQNQDLIIAFLKQLAQTEVLIGRKKLTELEALTSHNDRYKEK